MIRPLSSLLLALVATASATLASRRDPPVTALAFSPDGTEIVVGSQAGLSVRSIPLRSATARQLKTELDHVHAIVFSPDGKRFAAAGGHPGERGIVEIRSWPAGELLLSITQHDDVVYNVAWDGKSRRLATAGYDGAAQVFDSGDGKRISKFGGHSRSVLSVAWVDENTLASAGLDQSIRIWSADTGERRRVLGQHTGGVHALRTRPGEQVRPWLASIAEDRTVRLWQPTIGRLVKFARLPSLPSDLIWKKDGSSVVVSTHDGHLRIIDAATVETLDDRRLLDGRIHSLARADGSDRVAAGADNGQIFILDLSKEDES